MMTPLCDSTYGPPALVLPAPADADVLIVCEHASNHIPVCLDGLGLEAEVLQSHVAWDPGALGVAQHLATVFAAPIVRGEISRLVYDCNRPPEAGDAIPAQSEIYNIPGNVNLTPEQRQQRIDLVYKPFYAVLAGEIAARQRSLRVMVTVHSFTPVYRGQRRDVEIGILHGDDAIFAEAMMETQPIGSPYLTLMNEPYSATDGVAHTLDLHGATNDLPSVMLEIRNDLITTGMKQSQMANMLATWIQRALTKCEGRL
ncbi:N-formylglutamate amidohydrolase [Roseovarius sp. EL26]|uniref:N-formylglutamate amidohydrolase n=1 Tax=Roseovarius sp. EL26 TaxID=2126672 RepID=UPI000EA0C17A|nr:N-formylglutamate amidohydrolase [Roseovarius sp. EL26]